MRSATAINELRRTGPLNLTGPVAVTVATTCWLEEKARLRWDALTGLQDGGRSRLIDDVMFLPITGLWYLLTSPCHIFMKSFQKADPHIVPAAAGIATWAPNPLPTLLRASGIRRKDYGDHFI